MCGIVGIYHKKEPACGDIYDALIQVQHRGQDAAGISTWDTEKISTHKYTGLVTEVFKHQTTFDKLANLSKVVWCLKTSVTNPVYLCVDIFSVSHVDIPAASCPLCCT